MGVNFKGSGVQGDENSKIDCDDGYTTPSNCTLSTGKLHVWES